MSEEAPRAEVIRCPRCPGIMFAIAFDYGQCPAREIRWKCPLCDHIYPPVIEEGIRGPEGDPRG